MSDDCARLAAELAAYQVGEALSQGAWGAALAGRHRRLGREVVILRLSPALAADPLARARFATQARALAALDHPHIAALYDLIDRDEFCLLVMERVTGGALRDRLTAGLRCPQTACAALLAVCAGLEHAHRRGVLHGSLTPRNLMLTPAGVVKVTGMGMAGILSGPGPRASGQVIGLATDVHAAGAVLYQLLSGQLPEPSTPLRDLTAAVPPGVASAAMKALRPNPEERYASAEAFGVALAQAAGTAWGSGWLAKAEVTVAITGPILTAAFGASAPRELADPRPPGDAAGLAPVSEPGAATRIARLLAALLVAAAVAVMGVALLTRPAGAPMLAAGSGMSPTPLQQPAHSPPSIQAEATWRALRDAPVTRQQAATAVQDGVIWVFGGLEGDHATTTVEGYDPPIDTWKAGPDLPIPLRNAMAVSYRGELVVMGGWQPEVSNLTAITSDRVFAIRDGAWVELPKLNHPRAAGAAAVVGDRIVVAGGQADGQLVSATEVFDGTRWIDAARIPTPREHLAAASYGPFLYAVGGRALSVDRNSAALERYHPATDQWERLPPMPTARGGLGAAIVDGRLIAAGGEQPTGVFGTVQAYDIASSTWLELAPLLTPRHGLGVAAVGPSLYAIGGADRPTYTESSAAMEVLTLPPRPVYGDAQL